MASLLVAKSLGQTDTADFIKKGTWSVPSFNGDYLSIPLRAQVAAVSTFFMKSFHGSGLLTYPKRPTFNLVLKEKYF